MLHLGSIGRTSIDVDVSFLILIAFFVASFYDASHGMRYALLWAPILFVGVLLHELAHAAAIALFGYGSSRIILAGMGGLTINERTARPWHDMVIAFAGPLASFGLAFGAAAVFLRVPAARQDPMLAAFLPLLSTANMWWGILNLIPVAPLDGGHVVRHFLRMFLSERAAFSIAVWIAIVVGIAVVVFGIVSRYFILSIIVAWYVWVNFQQWRNSRGNGASS